MYHYVRPDSPGLPYFPYLALSDFERQLDYFAASFGIVGRAAFAGWVEGGPPPDGVLLTFDDGLRDHFDFVLPTLRKRRLFGLFYVPSQPVIEGRLLDVHKVHLALGRLGGAAVLAWLGNHASHLMSLLDAFNDAESPYAAQVSETATRFVKSLFNWQLTPEQRGDVLDALLEYAFKGSPPDWRGHNLEEREMRALVEAGMGVGPHGHCHTAPALLTPQQRREEIETSCSFVEVAGGSRAWGYCYPYGAVNAERAVAESGCSFAFATGAGDINTEIATAARYALPRHDCNAFPHGAAVFGSPKVLEATT
jgi:peptidoglycan/xylan/chitin deacetylase (PgdA/CDA1 family)